MQKYFTLSYHKTFDLCCVGENFTVESYKVPASNEKILIVDDEHIIRQVLKTRLKNKGYTIFFAEDGKEALHLYKQCDPNLIILDIMLPKLDGYEVCAEIRRHSQTPIIMLTALGTISERLMGLELGADDYVTKPFSPKELEARIRAVLLRTIRHATPLTLSSKNILQAGPLRLDFFTRQVFKGTRRIKLTSIEFSLLELLIANPGISMSRVLILDNVWGYTTERGLDTRLVDVHIARLRAKLEDDISRPELILTVRGVGYMFTKYLSNTE